MGNVIGSDPEQLDVLGQGMSGSADRLDVIRAEVTALLAHSPWEGVDADNFRHLWHYRLAGQLQAVATTSREQASSLHANATQQRQASATGEARSGGFPGGGGGWGNSGTSVLDYIDELLTTWDETAALTLLDIAGIGPQIIALLTNDKAFNAVNPTMLEKIAVLDVEEAFPKLATLGKVAELADDGLNWLSLAKDSFQFGGDIAEKGWTGDTIVKGVDVVFDAATILSVEVPPLALGIAVTHVGFDLAADYISDHPEVGKAVVDGATAAANTVIGAVGLVADDVGHAVSDAEHAATNFISGGISSVSHLFGG